MVTRLISAHACQGKGLRLDSGDFAHISRVFLNAAGTDHVWKFSPLNNFNYCQLASTQAPGHQWATQVIGHATIWLATELDKEMMDQQGLPSACSYSMVAVKERCMSGCGFQFVIVQFRFYSVCVQAHMHQLSNDDKCTCKFIYVTMFETHMLYLLTCRLRFLWGSVNWSSSYRHRDDPLFCCLFQKVDIVHPDGVARYPRAERSIVAKATDYLLQYSKRWPAARPLHGYF